MNQRKCQQRREAIDSILEISKIEASVREMNWYRYRGDVLWNDGVDVQMEGLLPDKARWNS